MMLMFIAHVLMSLFLQSAMAAGAGRARDHDFSGMDDDDPGIRAAKAEAMDGEEDSELDEGKCMYIHMRHVHSNIHTPHPTSHIPHIPHIPHPTHPISHIPHIPYPTSHTSHIPHPTSPSPSILQ